MRNVTSLARFVLGGYLAVHGAQKLFGAFGGNGIEGTAKGFEHLGLTPAREMAKGRPPRWGERPFDGPAGGYRVRNRPW